MEFSNSQLLTLLSLLCQAHRRPNYHEPLHLLKNITPVQHHLAYLERNGMTLSWKAFTEVEGPSISYGRNQINYIPVPQVVQKPILHQPLGTIMWKLRNLSPKTAHYYKVEMTRLSIISLLL